MHGFSSSLMPSRQKNCAENWPETNEATAPGTQGKSCMGGLTFPAMGLVVLNMRYAKTQGKIGSEGVESLLFLNTGSEPV